MRESLFKYLADGKQENLLFGLSEIKSQKHTLGFSGSTN